LDHIDYDNLNRPVAVTAASDVGVGNKVQYRLSYGLPTDDLRITLPAARVASAVSAVRTDFPNGTAETKLLDAQSRTIAMIDRNNSVITYSYGAAGKVSSFTDQSNLTTTYQYDRYGRSTAVSDPIRGLTTTTYTPLGDTVDRRAPTGRILTHYDVLNRPVDETTPEGTTTWTYGTEAGTIGKLVNVAGPATPSSMAGHQVHYTYGAPSDAAGSRGQVRQVTNTIAGEPFDLNYDYDGLGRLQAVHFPVVAGGARYTVDYAYSSGGRLSKVSEGDGGLGRTLWEITARDNLGRTKTAQGVTSMSIGYSYTGVEGLLSQLTASEGAQQKV
jgi:YD repeat-containing protein